VPRCGDLARPGTVVGGVPGGAAEHRDPLRDGPPQRESRRVRRDVVERGVVVQREPAADLRDRLDPDAVPEVGLRLELDAADPRPAAIAKEEGVGVQFEALDEAADAVWMLVSGFSSGLPVMNPRPVGPR
jgi:hypothetical protein